MAVNSRRKKQKWVRIIAIVLVALLAMGLVIGTLMSMGAFGASAEVQSKRSVVDRCELDVEYMPNEQALRISQRLVYTNQSRNHIRQVLFYATGNLFRRENTLNYEPDDMEKVFPNGYAPAGIDLQRVRFEGADADYGFQGEAETVIRVDCDLAPGESGTFEFDYYLLLMACNAFQGVGYTDVRLSAFYFAPGIYDEYYHEYRLNKPLTFTRWLYTNAMDYSVELIVPDIYDVAATGEEQRRETHDHQSIWQIQASNVREFALSFGKRYREEVHKTDTGITVRVLTNIRGAGSRAGMAALKAIEQCEAWFGAYPLDQMDIVQTDYPLEPLNYPGVVWIPSNLLDSGREDQLTDRIRFWVAQQIFGMAACVDPVADAWLSDSLCEYLACMMLEDEKGHDAFLDHINREWVSALQLTLPGGLVVSSDASLFNESEFDILIRKRGAVVFHELREAMGRDVLIDGLAAFAQKGNNGMCLTEMDLVDALNSASGGDWEAFLTDWVFNVGDYVDQNITWYE